MLRDLPNIDGACLDVPTIDRLRAAPIDPSAAYPLALRLVARALLQPFPHAGGRAPAEAVRRGNAGLRSAWAAIDGRRSEARRVGKECVRTVRCRWWHFHVNQNIRNRYGTATTHEHNT